MSRIQQRFEEYRANGRKALISYIAAGDPTPQITVPLLHALVDSGVDLLELGIPFSDPMADGPVIQRASERALAHGVTLADVLAMVAEFRREDNTTPMVLMGYLNPMETMGYETFAMRAAEAGVDGIICVDLPPEEADDVAPILKKHGIDPIFLLAPTTPADRLYKICENASGFVYYVSLKGVTGSHHLDVDEVSEKLAEIRQYTDLPIGVGFGIKTPEMAAAVAQVSDAVVVGSALVDKVASLEASKILTEGPVMLAEMKQAMENTHSH
ncbi:MAG: tryptophan synthase subunit alpha [Pseudomonadota bacterium]